ncbi:nucleotide sugar dehydrogenase, partial [Streptomyces pseudogriseolus]
MPADLAVIGLGPFGLPLAQAAVAAGIPTIGYRTGPEPGSLSPAEQRRMLAQGFRVTTSAAELGRVRTAVICAPTAPAADGGRHHRPVPAPPPPPPPHQPPHNTLVLGYPQPP